MDFLDQAFAAADAGSLPLSGDAAAEATVANPFAHTLVTGSTGAQREIGALTPTDLAILYPETAQTGTWIPRAADGTSFGTAYADRLAANTRQVGGTGNDWYLVTATTQQIVEQAGGGVDTAAVNVSGFTLPAHVENLVIQGTWAANGTGNDAANRMVGGTGDNRIDGGRGDDLLVGGAGKDSFVVQAGGGTKVIADFAPGSDTIRLAGRAADALSPVILYQSGANTVADLGNGQALVLMNVAATSLTAQDFGLVPVRMAGTAPAATPHDGMTMVFREDFDTLSLYDKATGTGRWETTFHDGARTHTMLAEEQFYTDAAYTSATGVRPGIDPFRLEDGVLSITAQKTPAALKPALGGMDYTSGILTTNKSFSFQYGYVEMKAKVPEGQGLWPALWMLREDYGYAGEIDIMEILGHDTDFLNSTLHVLQDGTRNNMKVVRADVPDLAAAFHTYGMSWNADRITFYLDGTPLGSIQTPDDLKTPMYLLANLAVGGEWPGSPDATTAFPSSFDIDYIHVYQDTANPPATVTYNVIQGSAAANTLTGTAKADEMFGWNGNDTLDGGAGADLMFGGSGKDTFVWKPGSGTDTFGDFNPAEDSVTLSGSKYRTAAKALAAVVQQGMDSVLDMGNGEKVILNGATAKKLTTANFIIRR